ncbi:2927_t:CDS:2 [Entrophospora sp. SA101]|nr:2927_t:CDS:2 [Entrophospora sp. SA101]CAJ0858156.1 2166_t:CDS:2 [Entrophospora sp. SA101]
MASNRNPYGNLDDAFETYIDMDFLRNDKLMEDETNNNNSRFWFAYVLVSTFLQQITSLFLEAVVTTPKQQMIPALFRHPVVLPELFPLLKEDDNKLLYVNVSDNYDDNIQLLNNNIVVESIKEASVLDWLYDSMLQQVVEQSQIEARIMELSSDWVGDDLDDNVLPLLF